MNICYEMAKLEVYAMKTVLVIGGGITGLSAMYELQKWKTENESDVQLVLVEATEHLGGKIRTEKKGEFIMETGADSIVSRKVNDSFLGELGLQNEIVYNATGSSFIFTDGEIKPIPSDSVFGIPASIESLASSTLVSAEGKVEALKDFYTQNESFTENDSIGDFLEYFLGHELVEKQIAPVLSGVYSGSLHDLTIASTLPYILEYKNKYGSIIKGFEANKGKFQSNGEKKFLSFKAGLSTLIDTMEAKLVDVDVRTSWRAKSLEKINDRYRVVSYQGKVIEADYVVLSIPHHAAEQLLNDKQLTEHFADLKTSSLISVYLGFQLPDSLLPKEGTGFITANDSELSCNACTWTSKKWSHTSKNHNLLVRLFYKSSHRSFADIQKMSEQELVEVALSDVKKAMQLTADPVERIVTNWSNNMPTYQITHPQTVQALEQKLSKEYSGLMLAGCSYYGVGIPDCIENGVQTANKIIERL